jgi:hypothetical protein
VERSDGGEFEKLTEVHFGLRKIRKFQFVQAVLQLGF